MTCKTLTLIFNHLYLANCKYIDISECKVVRLAFLEITNGNLLTEQVNLVAWLSISYLIFKESLNDFWTHNLVSQKF